MVGEMLSGTVTLVKCVCKITHTEARDLTSKRKLINYCCGSQGRVQGPGGGWGRGFGLVHMKVAAHQALKKII